MTAPSRSAATYMDETRDPRASAYLRAALDCVVMVDGNGDIVEFNPAAERTFGYTREEAIGQRLADLIVPPSLRERHTAAFEQYVHTGADRLFGRRLELTGMRSDGSEFPAELTLSRAEGEPLLLCGAIRDLTAARWTENELRLLAEEQAALRRVATLVANRVRPEQVFAAVAAEAGMLLLAEATALWHFIDGHAEYVSSWSRSRPVAFPRWLELDGASLMRTVREAGRSARIDDYEAANLADPGPVSEAFVRLGIRAAVGCPVIVDGRVWGVLSAYRLDGDPFRADAEERLASFTDLVAIAISNAAEHEELLRSRARLVAAGDEASQRIERNLHDGIQQRLVSVGLDLGVILSSLEHGLAPATAAIREVVTDLDTVLADVREISRGLHPAILTESGLGAALKALARRSTVPVELDVAVARRPSESTEIAAYYVVAEAIANASKHAHATCIWITVHQTNDSVFVTIRDDGVGGASRGLGSGLVGLADRVEALGGGLDVVSPVNGGTTIAAELPFLGFDVPSHQGKSAAN
jgi:PAS domain S-box-containing protein